MDTIECFNCGRLIWGYPCIWCDYGDGFGQGYETCGEATSTYVLLNFHES